MPLAGTPPKLGGSGSFATPPAATPAATPVAPEPDHSAQPPSAPEAPADGTGGDALYQQAVAVLDKDFPACPLEKWEHHDSTGQVYGAPHMISIDVLKKDRNTYLCDIRPVVQVNDVMNLIKIGKLYRTQFPTAPLACLIITTNIAPQAEEQATKFRIKVYRV